MYILFNDKIFSLIKLFVIENFSISILIINCSIKVLSKIKKITILRENKTNLNIVNLKDIVNISFDDNEVT